MNDQQSRLCKMAAVADLKVSLRFSIFFVIISVCLTFESWRDNSGTEFRGAVSKLGEKIQISGCVFTFSVKLQKQSSHFADLPRTGKNCTDIKTKENEGCAKFLFLSLNMHNLWPCLCRRVVDLKLLIILSCSHCTMMAKYAKTRRVRDAR